MQSECEDTPRSEFDSLDARSFREGFSEDWEANVRVRFADLVGLEASDFAGRELVGRMVRMLLLCGYDFAELTPIFAHALCIFDRVLPALPMGGAAMSPLERTAIAVLACYLAHAYQFDETCPLKYWQGRIYDDYCSLRDLNLAAMKVMRLVECRLQASSEAVEAKLELISA